MVEAHKSLDWEAARQRLGASERSLDSALDVDPKRVEAIFRQRAARLAKRQERTVVGSGTFRALAFSLRGERYGIDLEYLSEVLPFTGCTPVPGAPPELLGVINLRGEIRLVVDLARLLGFPQEGSCEPGYILMVQEGPHEIGLSVDGVEAVQVISPEDMAAAGEAAGGLAGRYLKTRLSDSLSLIDGAAILSDNLFEEAMRR